MMHNLQKRQHNATGDRDEDNAGPEDFIEVDFEAGLRSSNVPKERRYFKFR